MKLKDKLALINNDYPKICEGDLLSAIPNMTASFVIPSFNSAVSLSFVLRAVETQLLKDLIKEVIIVDDGSADNTTQVVELYARNSKLNIVYLRNQSRRYAAYSRNRGAEVSTGDIICFIDSDIIIPSNYLNYHLALHLQLPGVISLSLRSFTELDKISSNNISFPIQNYNNEFRFQKYIKHEWCDTTERKSVAGTTVRLIQETDFFRGLGFARSNFWTLPEICLGSSICYKREDVIKVNGVPENFVGWGYNDVALAAKVIALQRYVVPIINCGVYHIIHPRRSGINRDTEFVLNKKRYSRLLDLSEEFTYKSYIEELE